MPDKLPRKEDLLSAQHKDNPATPVVETTGESLGVKQSKEAAEIAENHAKQVKAETEAKLTELGYKSIEQGLADIAKQRQEADKKMMNAQQREASIAGELDQIAKEKQKLLNAYSIAKKQDEAILTHKAEVAKTMEEQQAVYTKTEVLKQEMHEIIAYYHEHTAPIVKILTKCVNILDDVRTVLRYPDHYNKVALLKYLLHKRNLIGDQADKIDQYLDKIPKALQKVKTPEMPE